ncbi:MAG TPA: hypothetical protein PLQ97_14925 [Myxococcota bacterium]|nr:hypothetical protein [Myxococcota bacterium]HQK52374.1 hypothetical protein [Myxococcota bacterium]
MLRRGIRVWVFAAATLALAASAMPRKAAAEPRAEVTLTVILARREPPKLHPGLQKMWDTLRRSFGDKFSFFDLAGETSRRLAEGERVETTLPNGDRFAAIFQGVTEDKGLLRIHLEMGEFRTKVRVHDGGVFFQAGRRHGDATVLIGVRAALVP